MQNPVYSLWSLGRRMFGYDATEARGRRKLPSAVLRGGDDELPPEKRKVLLANARDMEQNFSLVSWAVGKHLDYVSSFSLQIRTPNVELTKFLERKMQGWSKAENCDIRRMFRLNRMIRMLEARRTVDGDVGLLRLASGQLQPIEGDRIRTPFGGPPTDLGIPIDRLKHGVFVDPYGAPLGYSICRRDGGYDYRPGSGGFIFDRMIPSQHFKLHAYHNRFDGTRGVSPLASGLNYYRDTAETMVYALMKMKVSQLFGLKTTRKDGDDLGETSEEEDPESGHTEYKVDFGAGPFHLDMDPGDDAEFLENKTPPIELQQMLQSMIGLSLKSLDIPYSFYAENFSNYSGSRQALLQYYESAREKRNDNRELLEWITAWRIWLWWVNGELPGLDLEMFRQIECDWVASGLPWIDPLKEIQANIAAIEYGLTSPQRVCREAGSDWYEIQEERKKAAEYQNMLGISSKFNPIPMTINEGMPNAA